MGAMAERAPPTNPDLSRIVIPSRDPARAAAFYRYSLGLAILSDPEAPGGCWFEWGNGILLGLREVGEGYAPPSSGVRLVLRVDDVLAVRARIEARGGRIDPGTERPGRFEAKDPEGNRLIVLAGRGISARMESRSRVVDQRLLVEEEVRVAGTPEDVWVALTDSALLSAWFCGGPVRMDARRGGALEMVFPHVGRPHTTWHCRILDLIPGARLAFEEKVLGIEVAFDLAPGGENRTRLRLTQTPFDLRGLTDSPHGYAQRLALSWRRILRRLELLLHDELAADGDEEED